jgi:hypothetical protein
MRKLIHQRENERMSLDKTAKASYLANLIAIMESKESVGRARGTTITNEYNRVYESFIDDIKKEQVDETRHRTDDNVRRETRADQPRG